MTPPRSEGFVRIPDAEFEAILTRAAEEGAKRALADVGLDGDEAALDIRDLRSLVDCIRLVRRTAMQTAVRIEHHAAVDEQRRPDDVIGGIGGKPNNSLGYILGPPDAAIGDQLQELPFGLFILPSLLIDIRLDGPRGDRVDADFLARQLLCHALHQQLEPTLRGRVIGMARPGNGLVYRAVENDLAKCRRSVRSSLPTEPAHRLLRTKELARQVHFDHLVPVL